MIKQPSLFPEVNRPASFMDEIERASEELRKKGPPPYSKMAILPKQGMVSFTGTEPKQVIFGNIPAKSNCYKIITLPGKKPDPIRQECPTCLGRKTVVTPFSSELVECGACQGSGSVMVTPPRGHHSSLGKTTILTDYEKQFAAQCSFYKGMNIEGFFELEVDVYYPTQRSDLDNCLKILLDCLQDVKAIKNDNKCMRIVANKFIDKERPRIEFILKTKA